jgi:hypothetical protein
MISSTRDFRPSSAFGDLVRDVSFSDAHSQDGGGHHVVCSGGHGHVNYGRRRNKKRYKVAFYANSHPKANMDTGVGQVPSRGGNEPHPRDAYHWCVVKCRQSASCRSIMVRF